MNEQDRFEEEQRLVRVLSEIDRRFGDIKKYASAKKADIVDNRKNFWEDVRINFDDAGEAAETYRSIKQQADVLLEKERSYKQGQKQLNMLKRMRQSPYFGRVDFKEDGGPREQIYLGIASLLDKDEIDFLVYDWRAPVSSLYYDYSPGPASYKTPSGEIYGEMELKRQYMIRDGHIESMFDTGVTIGDELLQEVLGKQADAQMKSIVATIQKEQNRIIRDERSRLLIVQGAAGSGKTSAALQRAAYLLYRYRGTLRADQIVLFSPNTLFNSYVSSVLPELGEENMEQTTFQEYLDYRLGDIFKLEGPLDQMEFALTGWNQEGYDARIEGIRFKSSADFMEVIERYTDLLRGEGLLFKDVMFRDRVLIPAKRIKEHFYGLDDSIRFPNRMRLVVEWLLQELKEKAQLELKKGWVEEEVELLDKDEYESAYRKMLKEKRKAEDTFDDFGREQELLSEKVVKKYFVPVRSFVKKLQFADITAVYRRLFEDGQLALRLLPNLESIQYWREICSQTIKGLDRRELFYEDAAPYLFLKEQIEGFQTNSMIRHVFIDEAQDYSPFEFAFLKKMFPRSKMTVLGDMNQAIYFHSGSNSGFSPLYSVFKKEETESVILTRTYRSTKQIVDFTRGMIAGGENIVPFNRQGPKPTVTQAADQADLASKIAGRIKLLQVSGHRTVAVICKTAKESTEAYEALRNLVPLRLIGKNTTSYDASTLVIPSYLAKGVEFDAVLIFNGSKEMYGRESERKLFYTACTRAMHELHLYFTGVMSPFIADTLPETYFLEDGRFSNQ
ncbi:RNA polymerase recycling motor HelD [Paenibacillus larvae]